MQVNPRIGLCLVPLEAVFVGCTNRTEFSSLRIENAHNSANVCAKLSFLEKNIRKMFTKFANIKYILYLCTQIQQTDGNRIRTGIFK